MDKCPNTPKCPFFNDALSGMPATAQYYKNQYCNGNHSKCARFIVSEQLGRMFVPLDLFPKDTIRAAEIIARAQTSPFND